MSDLIKQNPAIHGGSIKKLKWLSAAKSKNNIPEGAVVVIRTGTAASGYSHELTSWFRPDWIARGYYGNHRKPVVFLILSLPRVKKCH